MKGVFATLKHLTNALLSRIAVCVLGILLQLAYLALLFWTLGTLFSYSYIVFIVIGMLVALYIICSAGSSGYKLIWVFVVLSLPIFGCMLYWFYGSRKRRNIRVLSDRYSSALKDSAPVCNADSSRQAVYLSGCCGFPLYTNTKTKYFPSGETVFPEMLEQLKKAESFIFIEYFIIQSGTMWDSILDILEAKAADGLDVRVIYDDMGCLLTLPRSYDQLLRKKGIRCCRFGPIIPLWSPKVNNRDHRKMMIIDGKCAFTGGINLADEYINAFEKHGHWKDQALMLCGDAVKSMTAMFLSAWDSISNEESDISRFMPYHACNSDGLVIPYMDSPLCREMIAENVFINLISDAKRYVYITTPYLILDDAMKDSLMLAARSGVDVRIITPHVPDKKIVFVATRANYPELLKDGVRIYEYLPGFIHAKSFIADDTTAIVGTVNLDFRSLYLHYECGVWMHKAECVSDLKADINETLLKCREMTTEDIAPKDLFQRVLQGVLRFFSPMM